MGTGTYGQTHPTVINCGFKPKMVLVYSGNGIYKPDEYTSNGVWEGNPSTFGCPMIGWVENVSLYLFYQTNYRIEWIQKNTGLSWYTNYDAERQNNLSNTTYSWLAIG